MMKVGDDWHVHDSMVLLKFTESIIKSDGKATPALGKLFTDGGAYNGNEIFRSLADKNGFLPY